MIVLHCLLVLAVALAHLDKNLKDTEKSNPMLQKQERKQLGIPWQMTQRPIKDPMDTEITTKRSETKLDEAALISPYQTRIGGSIKDSNLLLNEKVSNNLPLGDNTLGKSFNLTAGSTNSNVPGTQEKGTENKMKGSSAKTAKSIVPKDRAPLKKFGTLFTRRVSSPLADTPNEAAIKNAGGLSMGPALINDHETVNDAELRKIEVLSPCTNSRNSFLTRNPKTLNISDEKISMNTRGRYRRTTFEDERNFINSTDYCGEILGSCKVAANNQRWLCSCDVRCNYFRDCCYDFQEQRSVTIDTNNQTYESDYHFKCYNMYYSTIRYVRFTHKPIGFLAVGSCPESYDNKAVKDRCENGTILEEGPFVMNNNSIAFRNKMCAICNGIEMFESFRIYVFTFKTYDAIKLNRNQSSEHLFRSLHGDGENVQYALEEPVGTSLRGCLLRGDDQEITNDSLCHRYINPVEILTEDYQLLRMNNVHCTEGLDVLSTSCLREHDLKVNDKFLEFSGFQFKMAIMFTFSENEEIEEGECAIWNQKIIDTGKCQNYDVYRDVPSDLEVGWKSDQNLTEEILQQVAIFTPWFYTVDHISEAFLMQWEIEEHGFIVNVRMLFRCIKPSFLHELENFINIVQNRRVFLILSDQSRKLRTKLELSNGLKNISENKQVRQLNNLVSLRSYLKESYPTLKIQKWTKEAHVKAMYKDSHLIIEKVVLGEDIVANSNTSMLVSDIITYVSLSLSVVALLFLIIAQRKRGLVINISAANTENTALSLLLSDVSFMFARYANGNNALCYLLGCASHYLWLTFFSFLTICVLNVSSSFNNLNLNRDVHNLAFLKQKLKNFFLGVSLPFPFVTASICLDFFGPSTWSPGYANSACFPENYPANLVFFTGPIVVSMCVNLGCLIFIVSKVCATRKETLHVRKLNIYKEAVVFLRIVVISGLFWVSGIVASIIKQDWLYYIFTILCGLHGVFISISVMTSRMMLSGKPSRKTERKEETNVTSKF